MKHLCVVVVLIWYICVNENYLFLSADANMITVSFDFDDKSRNISCDNSLWINIHDISVKEESMSCKNTNCKLNTKDTVAIKDCNGKSICKLDRNFNTKCINEYGSFNISYMCKAICDFEDGICQFRMLENSSWWKRVTSIEIPTHQKPNTTMITDHTTGNGSFMTINSSSISSGEMKSLDIKSKGDKCLTFWYIIYGNVTFEIWNRHGVKRPVPQARKTEWLNYRFDIYLEDTDHIIFKVKFSTSALSVVALDDVSLTEGMCKDVITRIQPCIPTDEEYTFAGCHSFFLSELKINLTYNVSGIGQVCQNSTQMKEAIDSHCDRSDDWKLCKFKLKDLLKNVEDKCFQPVKKLSITYSCTDTPMLHSTTSIAATQPTNVMSSVYTRAATSTETDVMSSVYTRAATSTETDDSTMATEMHTVLTTFKSAHIPENISSSSASSTSVIGIVVGVVLSLIALSVLVVIAVIYFRRSRYVEKKGHSIVANQDSHSDYTGHQNTAFASEVNVTTQTDYCEIRKSKLNEHYHDITDTFSPSINTTIDDEYSEIANILNSPNSNPNISTNYQHQYISLDPNATGFDRSILQNNLHNESKNNHNSNEKTSFTGGDAYAILDPNDLNESKNNTPKVLPLSENYVVLDPNETGFNRRENTDTVCNYELATPINPTETSEDPYDVSQDETYDTSSNSRHKEKENNIYSHMVDNVYDTAGNQRKKEESDGTYDHFFGQKSEDDYDISKPL